MSFEAKDHPISDVLNKAVFTIPRNQRKYVWDKDNWNDLFQDVLFSITEDKPHFIGSIVLSSNDKKEGLSFYTIIDGQQRIITITLFIVAIMKLFKERDMNDDFLGTVSYIQSKNNRNQDLIILSSDYHTSIENFVEGILHNENSKITMNAFVNTHTISKTRDKQVAEAVKYFYSVTKEEIERHPDPNERLLQIKNALLDMIVVKIVSSSEEDSYTIFEILNARGQELKSHELLKNFIMRYIQPIETRDSAKTKWDEMEQKLGNTIDRFVNHYAIHRYGEIKGKYKSPYEAIYKENRGGNIGRLLDDMKLKSEYYFKMISPSKEGDDACSETEYEVFSFFKSKKFEQFRPILLSLLHQKELENIDDNQYEQSLKYIYNFFVCYKIIGEEKSNNLEDIVFKHAPILENEYSYENLITFAKKLKKKIPSLDWFIKAFENIGWSDHFDLYAGKKNKERVQIVLEIVEKYIAQTTQINVFTIEHILPDSMSILNSQIGNLIPLERKINENCATEALVEKIEKYKKSQFASTRGFAERFSSQEFKPENRTKYLARLIFNNILELNQTDFSDDE